jgi:hypothetical protein
VVRFEVFRTETQTRRNSLKLKKKGLVPAVGLEPTT